VQYFQRARFEYHPERAGTPDEVQLAPLDELLLREQGQLPFAGVPLVPLVPLAGAPPPAEPEDGSLVLPDPLQPGVGHLVRGAFRSFYESIDGPRLLGLPLSEEVPWLEPGLPPERAYPVQSFQRARLEYRPAQDDTGGTAGDVRLSLLGDEYLRRRGLLDSPSPIGRIP